MLLLSLRVVVLAAGGVAGRGSCRPAASWALLVRAGGRGVLVLVLVLLRRGTRAGEGLQREREREVAHAIRVEAGRGERGRLRLEHVFRPPCVFPSCVFFPSPSSYSLLLFLLSCYFFCGSSFVGRGYCVLIVRSVVELPSKTPAGLARWNWNLKKSKKNKPVGELQAAKRRGKGLDEISVRKGGRRQDFM